MCVCVCIRMDLVIIVNSAWTILPLNDFQIILRLNVIVILYSFKYLGTLQRYLLKCCKICSSIAFHGFAPLWCRNWTMPCVLDFSATSPSHVHYKLSVGQWCTILPVTCHAAVLIDSVPSPFCVLFWISSFDSSSPHHSDIFNRCAFF